MAIDLDDGSLMLARLLREIEEHPAAREIVLTSTAEMLVLRELRYFCVGFDPAARLTIYGLPVKRAPSRLFCRNCGAPIEPLCSYCRSSADYVEIR